jgi:hypothetical protein
MQFFVKAGMNGGNAVWEAVFSRLDELIGSALNAQKLKQIWRA